MTRKGVIYDAPREFPGASFLVLPSLTRSISISRAEQFAKLDLVLKVPPRLFSAGMAAVGEYFMHLLKNGIAAALVTFGTSAAGAGEAYYCSAYPLSGTGWIPAEFVIEFMEHRNAARVSDTAFSATVPGRVIRRSETSLEVSWSAAHAPVGSEPGAVRRFRALLNMANMKMTIKAMREEGMIRLSRGAGRCVPAVAQSLLAQRSVN
ncbi:hypothetical protein ACOHWE_01410 [Cribrihabitans neustonicus]